MSRAAKDLYQWVRQFDMPAPDHQHLKSNTSSDRKKVYSFVLFPVGGSNKKYFLQLKFQTLQKNSNNLNGFFILSTLSSFPLHLTDSTFTETSDSALNHLTTHVLSLFYTHAHARTHQHGQDLLRYPGWIFTKLLRQICKIFVTLGLKILRFFRLKVLFEADIIKG